MRRTPLSIALAPFLFVVALLSWQRSAVAAPRVAVLRVEFEGRIPEVSKVSLSERLVEGLARAGFEVSAGDVLKGALANGPGPQSCRAEKCYRDIAVKLALDFLVIAHVKMSEKNYNLKLQLVGGQTGRPAGEERESCELCGILEVGEKLDKLASSLTSHIDSPKTADPARLTVQSQPAGASVTVDGRAAGETPLSLELSPGTHELGLTAAGHMSARKKMTLEPGVRGLVSVDLTPLDGHSRAPGGWFGGRGWRPLGWVAVAAGVALLGGGFTALHFDGSTTECPEGTSPEVTQCTKNTKVVSGLLLGAGAATAVLGGVVLLLDWSHADAAEVATGAEQHWTVSARGTF